MMTRCDYCGTVWDTEPLAWECSHDDRMEAQNVRKGCLGCAATLAISDPDLYAHCDVHGIIVVNGRAYQPVH